MNNIPYHRIDALAHYYLEDSYVLAVHVFPGKLVVDVDAVLTESHPSYTPPAEGEQYCFRRIEIIFDGVTSMNSFSLSYYVATGATGEKDMGDIDSLTIDDENRFRISGPWGSAEFVANIVGVNLL